MEAAIKLNEAQAEIVEHNEGSCIVCAGAGSGKTRVVVERITRMVKAGVPEDLILATTFTKKGAGVMNERLQANGVTGCRVGTFHSVCLQIIRDGSQEANFAIDDNQKMHYVLKDIIGYRDMNWQGADITAIEEFIGTCKNALVKPEQAEAPEIHGRKNTQFVTAYKKYEQHRVNLGLLTFDDMLSQSVWFLQDDQDARNRWSSRWEHIIVDEFQDTNAAQYELMKILSSSAKTLMVVGDDDQLIFQWRGSVPEYTLTFQERFQARAYHMMTNYRSRPEILEVANRVIKNNEERIVKENIPARGPGGQVKFETHADMDAEAQSVAAHIMELVADGYHWRDFAVLYRTNAQSRAFEEAFIREKIPHIVIGGTEFYKRKEVADLLAYVRVAVRDDDDEAAKRAINRPFRFIGKQTLDKMGQYGRSIMDVARNLGDYDLGIWSKQEAAIEGFVDVVDKLRADLAVVDPEQSPLPKALSNLLENSGYEQWITKDEGTDTAENSRISNIRELVRTSGRFHSAQEMLEYIDSMLAEKRKRKDDDEGADLVQVMTLHKSKGLEFPVVFLVGCAKGILPHARAEVYDEERRLFYVGVTRAEDKLFVSCPKGALVKGRLLEMEVSPFVVEAGLTVNGQ